MQHLAYTARTVEIRSRTTGIHPLRALASLPREKSAELFDFVKGGGSRRMQANISSHLGARILDLRGTPSLRSARARQTITADRSGEKQPLEESAEEEEDEEDRLPGSSRCVVGLCWPLYGDTP